jgi:hypothetical protein
MVRYEGEIPRFPARSLSVVSDSEIEEGPDEDSDQEEWDDISPESVGHAASPQGHRMK